MELKKDLKYEEALEQLQEIVSLLERKEIKIDDLADKVKEAKALVEFCRKKLEKTEEEINKIIEPENNQE
ncbi:exodeoxyribonuclease VII small subunit [Paracrocinitomix mangrovi]|uniref:exodeoxyribonuclease VII small subunit n=1 Tax=Paracrocinitomix mangrovi TaxID=2862509 RepID=UPI001C8E92D5|nr:exodeoxyribonuclease VII small subunit [Paracrocinitomix mangrovi]UKN01594.1 exodeoxyribonuclease VII small subunit [Paracrocinitomix mangrovi]